MTNVRKLARAGLTGMITGALFLILAQAASATLTGGPDIIPAPASVVDDSGLGGASNTNQQAFDERQVVLLPHSLEVDGHPDFPFPSASIPGGTLVSSHMIFLNQPDCAPCTVVSSLNQTWTFSGAILGVMSDFHGDLEGASSGLLGAPGTVYPLPFDARGMEHGGTDKYVVAGNSITVDMSVTQPGDWIRVVTAATKNDCKNGGWITSNLQFKNQGDCVSYVETHGGNEPGQNVPTSME